MDTVYSPGVLIILILVITPPFEGLLISVSELVDAILYSIHALLILEVITYSPTCMQLAKLLLKYINLHDVIEAWFVDTHNLYLS